MALLLRPPRLTTDGRYRLASGISHVANPLLLATLLGGLVVLRSGGTFYDAVYALGIGALFFGLLPGIYLLYLLRTGATASLEIRVRSRRTRPYFVAILCCLGAAAAFATLLPIPGRAWLVAIALSFTSTTVVLLIINTRHKISLHAAMAAAFTAVLFVVDSSPPSSPADATATSLGPLAPAGLLIAPLIVSWARVHSGAHTWMETASGVAVSALLTAAQLFGAMYLFPQILD